MTGHTDPPPACPPAADPTATAIEDATEALAEADHRGLRHAQRPDPLRMQDTAAALARTGLGDAAVHVGAVVTELTEDGPEAAVERWTDAHLFLLTVASL
ncbi:hypothetical protein ACFZAV_38870 [Streptomyces sp. NPDC008343]|uniref:hypothetical protein n=1 Tax=Streptomyces sp. NPDC008343 TaxID=3364828 RepID=UPI0036E6CDE3